MKHLRVLIIASLFWGIACATLTTEESNQRAEAHYKIGVAHLNETKTQQAFVEFQKALEFAPRDKRVLNAIGYIYLMYFDETDKAIDAFEKAIKADPVFSDAYNNLGYAYEKLGRFDMAISYYKKAVSNLMYATPEKSYISMGNSYYRMGKYEEALYSYKEAVKRAPNLDLSYMRMALCYNAMGRYGDAATAMTYAISLGFKGDREKAFESFTIMKLKASGNDEKDIQDYLEIMKY